MCAGDLLGERSRRKVLEHALDAHALELPEATGRAIPQLDAMQQVRLLDRDG